MGVKCSSGPITAFPTNGWLLGEKRTGAIFQIDISKTESLVRVYTVVKRIDRVFYRASNVLFWVLDFMANLVYEYSHLVHDVKTDFNM